MQAIIDRIITYVSGTGDIGSTMTTKYIKILISIFFMVHGSQFYLI